MPPSGVWEHVPRLASPRDGRRVHAQPRRPLPRLHGRAGTVLAAVVRPQPAGDPLSGDAELDGALVQSAGRPLVAGLGVSRSPGRVSPGCGSLAASRVRPTLWWGAAGWRSPVAGPAAAGPCPLGEGPAVPSSAARHLKLTALSDGTGRTCRYAMFIVRKSLLRIGC